MEADWGLLFPFPPPPSHKLKCQLATFLEMKRSAIKTLNKFIKIQYSNALNFIRKKHNSKDNVKENL